MKKIIIFISLLTSLLLPLGNVAYADNPAAQVGCSAVSQINPGANCSNGNTGVGKIISTVVNIFSMIIGGVAVIMVMVAGFRFMTSGGDQNTTKSARESILYSIIGLGIALLAQFIIAITLGTASTLVG